MKLVVLIGDSAVGKMTVGQELAKQTGLRLFHNHMTIEPVIEIFGYYHRPTVGKWREAVFEEYLKTDGPGLIFTYMWAFDQPSEWAYIEHVRRLFADQGAACYFVELIAPQEVRLARNASENRLKHKPSKRDLAVSKERLLQDDVKYRCVSQEGEIPYENYLRLENAQLSPQQAAQIIREQFSL